jgi:hypothetical protein
MSPTRRELPTDDSEIDPQREGPPWNSYQRPAKWWEENGPADLVRFEWIESDEGELDVAGMRAWQLRRGEWLAQNGLMTPGEIRWLERNAEADRHHSGLAPQAKKARYLLSLRIEKHSR